MKTVRLVLVGFGNVGKAFVELICNKKQELADRYGFDLLITGVATGHHGCAVNPVGIDPTRLLELAHDGGNYSILNTLPGIEDSHTMIEACPGDVLLENSPVNHESGQPAISHLKIGFENFFCDWGDDIRALPTTSPAPLLFWHTHRWVLL